MQVRRDAQREDYSWQTIWKRIANRVDNRAGNPANMVPSPVSRVKRARPVRAPSRADSPASRKKAARIRKTTRIWTVSAAPRSSLHKYEEVPAPAGTFSFWLMPDARVAEDCSR